MPLAPKPVRQSNRRVETRARAMKIAITRWMLRAARTEAREATRALSGVIGKAASDDAMAELVQILINFGVSQALDASTVAASTEGLKDIISPQALRQAIGSKDFKIKIFDEWVDGAERRAGRISAETKNMVRESLRRIMAEAADEVPRPSVGEVARRIRNQFHGGPDSRVYAFSPERAETIARTELVQAENTGIMQGYKAAGVERVRWLAYSDGRSGNRHHEEMNGEEIDVGGTFTTPLGNALRWPGDPDAPIEDTVNCRCTVRAVIV